jgi:hypothetical protein
MRTSTKLAAMALALTLTLTPPAFAAINVELNGHPLTFDVPPVVEAGRTLVPVRAIFEALGARITWDPASQTISAVHPERNRYVILKLGSTTAWVDGREVTLDVAPRLIDGRTMVPLRFVSTAMGADVSYDAATQTVVIRQAPLPQPAEQPDGADAAPGTEVESDTSVDAFVDPSKGATPDADLTNAQLLSRFTRSVAYTHLDKTWLCVQGMQNRFDDFAYGFTKNDAEWLNSVRPDLDMSIACWNTYEQTVLPTLPVPVGAEAAHQALQRWVDLNQNALEQLKWADEAHRKGDTAERDRLFQEGQQVLQAAFQQEKTMLAAMNAITSPDPEFLTVEEHQYVAWLDDMMGLTDNCFSQLHRISLPGEDNAFWANAAAACMVELPETLSEKTPPTDRMKALQQGAFAMLAPVTKAFTNLAAKLQAGSIEADAVNAEIEAIDNAWYEARPTWDQLFVYRDWGKF